MTITYFLGNGFDLGLGLKTRYEDFYSCYCIPKSGDPPLVVKFKKTILENKPTWADAEEAFGALPFSDLAKEFGLSLAQTIVTLDESFQRELKVYLHEVQREFLQRAKNCKGLAEKLLQRAATSMEKVLAPRAFLDGIRKQGAHEAVVVNFVTLNYTATLEALLANRDLRLNQVPVPVGSYLSRRGYNYISLGEVVHAHGHLGEKYRLFGVNDSTQIVDEAARQICADHGLLIKTKEDGRMPVGDRDRAERVIRESDYIVILGVSYGITDTCWWDFIAANATRDGRIEKIVLCPYEVKPQMSYSPGAAIIRSEAEITRYYTKLTRDDFSDVPSRDVCAMMDIGPFYRLDEKDIFCDPLGLMELQKIVRQNAQTDSQADNVSDSKVARDND